MVDLDALKKEIETIGNRIRDLKASNGTKEDIGAAVNALKEAKKQYAENNNYIGVDGKPYTDHLTKAQKKALAKSQAQASGEGGAQPNEVRIASRFFVPYSCQPMMR